MLENGGLEAPVFGAAEAAFPGTPDMLLDPFGRNLK